jgi:ABC-type phosphate transport system auxiliary subunit
VTPPGWIALIGSVLALAGVVYNAYRAGKSSDRAQRVALQTREAEAMGSAAAAENSGFTRAQEMVKEAAKVQQEAFDSAMRHMNQELERLRLRVDAQQERLELQADKLHEQHEQIVELQRGRQHDREQSIRYIRQLLSLLEKHEIVYPEPPPFFDPDSKESTERGERK